MHVDVETWHRAVIALLKTNQTAVKWRVRLLLSGARVQEGKQLALHFCPLHGRTRVLQRLEAEVLRAHDATEGGDGGGKHGGNEGERLAESQEDGGDCGERQ